MTNLTRHDQDSNLPRGFLIHQIKAKHHIKVSFINFCRLADIESENSGINLTFVLELSGLESYFSKELFPCIIITDCRLTADRIEIDKASLPSRGVGTLLKQIVSVLF